MTDAAAADEGADEQADLHKDAELVRRIAQRGFTGLEYDTLINDLAEYGHRVMSAWIHTGEAYRRARLLHRPVDERHRPRPPVTPDDAAAIAGLAVAYGLPLFIEHGLKRCGWRANGGASLRSYFINSCLLKFSNASRAWVPDSHGRQFTNYDVVDQIPSQRKHDYPEEIAILRAVITSLLRDEEPEIRTMLELHVEGFTHQEIADELGHGLTAKAVERKMDRARTRIAQRGQGREG